MRSRFLLVISLLLIAVALRSVNLDEFYPSRNDEQLWVTVGTSIMTGSPPASWTLFGDVYAENGAVSKGAFVEPFLDHPPLFALLVSALPVLMGKVDIQDISWLLVRIPMILISFGTLLVTYLLALRLFNRKQALFTLAAFVFFPTHIISSRIVAAEHFIGFLLILGLYIYYLLESAKSLKSKRLLTWLLVLIAIMAPLAKLTGIVVGSSLALLAFYKKKRLLGFLMIGAIVISLLLFAGYGYFYSWDIFTDLLSAHHERPQSVAHWWTFFTRLDIGNFSVFDPSIIIGLIGVIALAANNKVKNSVYLMTPLIVFSFLFSYVAPHEAYGWYKYAVYPLIAMGLGYVFTKLFEGQLVYYALFIPLLSVMLQISNVIEPQYMRWALLLFYGLAVWPIIFRDKWLKTPEVFLSLMLVLFLLEIAFVRNVLGY